MWTYRFASIDLYRHLYYLNLSSLLIYVSIMPHEHFTFVFKLSVYESGPAMILWALDKRHSSWDSSGSIHWSIKHNCGIIPKVESMWLKYFVCLYQMDEKKKQHTIILQFKKSFYLWNIYLYINAENCFPFLIYVKHFKLLLECNCLFGKHHCLKSYRKLHVLFCNLKRSFQWYRRLYLYFKDAIMSCTSLDLFNWLTIYLHEVN